MKDKISTLDIKITNKCNYACEYCFGEPDQTTDIDLETFNKSLLLAKALGANFLEFCGGEPLMHPEFAKLTAIAKENNFDLILRSNGILIGKYLDLIAKNFQWWEYQLTVQRP